MALALQRLKKRYPSVEMEELKPPRKNGRFDGLTEEEVAKNTLKDILKPNLDLVFVGINPSLMAAHTGRYYAGPGNHFYKLLYASELIPQPITHENDDMLLQYNIGLTNIVARATRSSADLSKAEIRKGALIVQSKLRQYEPKIAIFNGKCIYEEFAEKYDKSSFRFGLQPSKVGKTALWVVPSSSARCANFPRMQDKLHFYTALKKYLAYLKGEIENVNLEEFSFEGRCKQAIPSTSKMWRRKGISVFTNGGKIVNKETICMDTSDENIFAMAIPRSTEFIVKNVKESDSEKDSNATFSQSDNLLSQISDTDSNKNISSQELKLSPKRKFRSQKGKEKKISEKPTIEPKNRKETIDFMSLIKQKLSNKEDELSKDQNIKESTSKKVKLSSRFKVTSGLKFANLQSNKTIKSFKVKTLDDGEENGH
ncbi:hypothetical protein TKK_0010891 [Trichogramma kaykai]|uniref:G/T mismatch-specific thymine DNA glycosylase n=1 Tax=Trichogramma kaykai TaxID=54128 RepID=A0ABD2WUR1_9HYME